MTYASESGVFPRLVGPKSPKAVGSLGRMSDLNNNLLSLRDCVRIAFRHKCKALAVFAVLLGSSCVCAMLWPPSYVSEAKLLVRLGRSSVALDPTATVGQTVATHESRERELSSALEILGSRELFDDVIKHIGAGEILRDDRDFAASADQLNHVKSSDDAPKAWDAAVRKLQAAVSQEVARNSSVITLSCRARSPELAQAILTGYVDAFTRHHLKLHRTSGSYEFFAAQAKQLQERLQTASAELRDAKNKIGVTSIESELKMLQQRLATLEQGTITAQTSLADSRSKLAKLVEKYPGLSAAEPADAGVSASPAAVSEMRKELYRLKITEGELLGKYSPNHPTVVAFQDRIEKAQRVLDHQEFISETSNAQSMEVKIDELENQYNQTKTALLRLNEDSIEIKALEQRVKALTANLQKYEEGREQARIDTDLESTGISNVNVAQAPTFSPHNVSPKKSLFLVLGTFLAGFGAFVVTMAAEYFDDTLHSSEQVEAVLQMPVVLSVPKSRAEVVGQG